jgi:hypothetical protein
MPREVEMEERRSRDRGKIAEEKFRDWLKQAKIAYWYIQQDVDTFSPALKEYGAKRPDFMLLLPNLGTILVDVEQKTRLDKYERFVFDAEETEKYINLLKNFNLQVWYVISNDDYAYKTWFWIPVIKVPDIGDKVQTKDGRWIYSVDMEKFIQLTSSDSLSRLFSVY